MINNSNCPIAFTSFLSNVFQTKLRTTDYDDDDSKKDSIKTKRKKIKKEEDEDDEVTSLTQEKQNQCAIILEELNKKIQLVTWKPN